MAPPPVPNWQTQILHAVGAPITKQNLLFINDWAKAEGGSASNNPFNTTQPAPGAGSYNSVGVRNYGSPQQGIQATVQTLENGRYGGIISALKDGTSAKASAQALAASPWGTGSLVEKMLGGQGGESQVSTFGAGAPGDPSSSGAPAADIRHAFAQNLLGSLDSHGVISDGPGFVQALQQRQGSLATAPQAAPLSAPSGGPRGGLTSLDGIQVDPAVAAMVASVVKQFGVTPTSGYRSAAHNAAVGGAENSDHLSGDAVDFSGTPAQLHALYNSAQGKYAYVEPWAQTGGSHVHISFARPGK